MGISKGNRVIAAFAAAGLVFGLATAARANVEDPLAGTACHESPVTTPGASLHVGPTVVTVPSVSKLKVCVNYNADVSGTPAVTAQPGCGSPCYTVEVRSVRVYSDVSVMLSYFIDGKPQTIGPITPGPVDVGQSIDRICFGIHMSTTDPCDQVPSVPQELTAATAKKAGKVRLAWQASLDRSGGGLAGYEIQRSETGAEETFTVITTTTSTTFVDSGLASGTTYYYRIVAFDTEGFKSAPSNIASAEAR